MTTGEIISAWVNGLLLISAAFALGWFMRGDMIYGGMFSHQVDAVQDMALPINGITK